jgi:hypothetical protein
MTQLLIFTMVATLLAGCSELQYRNNSNSNSNWGYSSSPGFVPVIDSGLGVSLWLDEVHATRTMTPEQLQQTLEKWEREFRDNPSVANRMRLALLLATGDDVVRDRLRARKLLNRLDTSILSGSEQELVAILQQYINDQGKSIRKINILWEQVTDQNRRIEELEQQLHALTTIEQNIQQRDKMGSD